MLYKKNRMHGMSAYKAARAAGYTHATAINAHKNIENRCDFGQELIKAGLTDDVVCKKLMEGLDANKVISANITYGEADEKTNDFIEVPDVAVRHKYLETVLKLTGKLKDKIDINASVKLVEMRTIEIVRDTGRIPLEFKIGQTDTA